jgi:hypothetical protein
MGEVPGDFRFRLSGFDVAGRGLHGVRHQFSQLPHPPAFDRFQWKSQPVDFGVGPDRLPVTVVAGDAAAVAQIVEQTVASLVPGTFLELKTESAELLFEEVGRFCVICDAQPRLWRDEQRGGRFAGRPLRTGRARGEPGEVVRPLQKDPVEVVRNQKLGNPLMLPVDVVEAFRVGEIKLSRGERVKTRLNPDCHRRYLETVDYCLEVYHTAGTRRDAILAKTAGFAAIPRRNAAAASRNSQSSGLW